MKRSEWWNVGMSQLLLRLRLKTLMKWISLFPAAVPTQNIETIPDENPDMWVHCSVRGSAGRQPKLLFIYPSDWDAKIKAFCFPADVGDRRLALLQFWHRGFFKKRQSGCRGVWIRSFKADLQQSPTWLGGFPSYCQARTSVRLFWNLSYNRCGKVRVSTAQV